MRGDVGASAAGERERVLELRAHGKQGPRRRNRQRQRLGGVTARAADDRRPPGHHPRDRVVVAGADLAVVEEERVGQAGQALGRVRVVGRQRLVGEIAGRQHDRPAHRRHEQVVERRVGQEDAHVAVLRDHRRRQRGTATAADGRQHDRPLRALEQASLGRAEHGQRTGGRDVASHHRERLCPPPLAVAQPADRDVVGRITGEVVAAETLDRHDAAGQDVGGGGQQGGVAGRDRSRGGRRAIGEPGAAGRAGHGLGVEPAIRGARVLGSARRAERERPHRRGRPVVRQVIDDRRPRAAVRAVRERVPVAPVGGVEQLAQAVVAGGDVGREEALGRRGRDALLDLEARRQGRGLRLAQRANRHALHVRPRRRIGPEAAGQRVEGGGRASGLDLHAPGDVAHPAVQAELGGEAPDERTEAHALDDAVHDEEACPGGQVIRNAGWDAGVRPHGCSHAQRLRHGCGAGRAERPVDGRARGRQSPRERRWRGAA